MAYLEWQDNLSVGETSLDADHKKLIGLINRVYEAMASGDEQAEVASVLDELLDYTTYHFDREEHMLRVNGFPDYDEHRSVHKSMIAQVQELRDRFSADPASVKAMDTMDFLSRWLINHIVGKDLKYKAYVNGG